MCLCWGARASNGSDAAETLLSVLIRQAALNKLTIKIVQSVSYQHVFSDTTGALLLRNKHCLLVHIGSSMIFIAGRSQVLQTNYKCRVAVAHASQLLELNAQRALQRHHVVAISLLVLKPCRRSHLCRSLWSTPEPLLLRRWNFVRASCTLLSRHFFHTRTRLIGHMA